MTRRPCIVLSSSVVDMRYLRPAFEAACPGVELRYAGVHEALGDVVDIEAAVCWQSPDGLLARLPNLKLVQSLAAGVDHLIADPALPRQLAVCRVVDAATLAAGMTAYVTWAIVQHHRRMQGYIASQAARRWREQAVTPPVRHVVGIAGLGTLGTAAAAALATIGYTVRGWSRSPRPDVPAGVVAFHGAGQLEAFLADCDALVCLLPLTAETRGFLNAACFAKLARGAHVVNVGRGDHLVESDLLAAMASGQVGAATLDAFSQEPLPPGHPFWTEPRIVVTPHIATRTDPAVVASQTLANLEAVRRGAVPSNAVDLERGY